MMLNLYEMGQSISAYAWFAAAGCVTALLYCVIRAPRYGLDRENSAYLFVCGFLGLGVGAKLLYLLITLPQLVSVYGDIGGFTPEQWKLLLTGGFVFYGGLGGFLAGTALGAKYFHWDWHSYVPLFLPAMCLFHILGRLGCYAEGCCYGRNGLPVQLMEAGAVALFLLLYALRKWEHPLQVYLIGYGILRFLLEFLRGDGERGFVGPLSVSQWISLAILVWFGIKSTRSTAPRNC